MNDVICTNCRGESTSGCWLCNPSFHMTPTVMCDCNAKDRRIAELEADLRLSVNTSDQLAKRIAELEQKNYDTLYELMHSKHRAERAENELRAILDELSRDSADKSA